MSLIKENIESLIKLITKTPRGYSRSIMNSLDNEISKGVIKSGNVKNAKELMDYLSTGGKITKSEILPIARSLANNTTNIVNLRLIANEMVNNNNVRKTLIGKTPDEIRDILVNKNGFSNELTDIIIRNLQIYKSANKVGFSSLKRGKFDEIVKGFKSGYKSSPDVLAKIFKNVRKLHWPTREFTSKEYKQLLMWLSTGSSRMPSEIYQVFRRHGFGPGIASFGGEFVKKYFTLLMYFTGLKLGYQIIVDLLDGKDNYPDDATALEIILDRLKRVFVKPDGSITLPDAKWVVPVTLTWPVFETILGPILRGNSPWGNILNKLESKANEYDKELKNMVNKTKENVIPKTSTGIDDFKEFIKQSWSSDYDENNVNLYKKGDYYIANDKTDNLSYFYIKNNNKFEYAPQ